MSAFARLMIWLGSFVTDGSSGLPSVKRLGYAMSVTILSFVMGAIGGVISVVTWESHGTPQATELVRIIASTLEVLAGLVLTAVTTGYVAGKAVERAKDPSTSETQAP